MTIDYLSGGVLGPFTVESPGALLVDSVPASFAPRAFSNNWRLLLNPRTKFSWRSFFNEARTGREGFKAVSQQYWRPTGADGKALHHLWIQQQTALPRWLEPLRNSGANLLEIGSPLNSWMGGRLLREWGFRGAVATMLATVGYGSYKAMDDLLYGDPAQQGVSTIQPEGLDAGLRGTTQETTIGDQGSIGTVTSISGAK
jgi:hypothetical protein